MATSTKKMEDGAGQVRFRRWKNMTIGARISLVILIAIIVVAALADFIAPYSPYEIFTSFCAPDSAHLFGTDDKGRDVMSRLMCGAKYSLVIGLGATGFALVVGSIIGAIAAVVRPRIADVIMRILDIIMSFPGTRLPPPSSWCSATPCRRSSSPSAFCTSRRSPVSFAPTS